MKNSVVENWCGGYGNDYQTLHGIVLIIELMCAKRNNAAFNTTVGTVNVDLPAKTKSRKNFIKSRVV